MKLTFLGAGDAFAFQQGHNSVLLDFGSQLAMIDCPATNRRALFSLEKELSDIEHLIVTHLHEDHINGVQQFAYFHNIVTKRKPHLYIHENLVKGFWESVRQGLRPTTKGIKELEDYFILRSVKDKEPIQIAGFSFQFIQTEHVPEMYSYGIYCPDYFYFSGDSNVDGHFLNDIHSKVKVIFHDCHLWDMKIESHASLEDILYLPLFIRKKTVLMHYHDGYCQEEQRKSLEQRTKLILAYPNQEYDFGT